MKEQVRWKLTKDVLHSGYEGQVRWKVLKDVLHSDLAKHNKKIRGFFLTFNLQNLILRFNVSYSKSNSDYYLNCILSVS